MDMPQIREHYTARNLEAVAEKLSQADAHKMFDTMESIARIIVGEAAFCAASATDGALKDLAKQHLDQANLWADYLAEQKARYQG